MSNLFILSAEGPSKVGGGVASKEKKKKRLREREGRGGERRWKPEAVYKGRERLVSIWDNPKC